MRCIHPVSRRYLDLLGVEHSISCPCGKCVACLHNFQQSWFVRILEHCKAYPRFVYETLTLAPKALQVACVPELNDFVHSDECPSSWKRHLTHYVDKDGFYCVPLLDKSVIQKWIKRGRENYFNDSGARLDLSYFAVLEYGPKYSRPHVHLMLWGVPSDVYCKYFQEPWQKNFGFTDTHFLGYYGSLDGKDISCISRYISKYVNKGSFESPFVKLGLAPKPFRLISKGIGVDYLRSSVFAYFRSPAAEFAKSLSVDAFRKPITCDFAKLVHRSSVKYRHFDCPFLHTAISHRSDVGVQLSIRKGVCDGWLKPISERDIFNISFYVHNGFQFVLPRYYRDKLLNSYVPNYFKYQVQNSLLENTRVLFNQNLQRFAASLGYSVKWDEVKSTFAGFGRKLFHLLSDKFAAQQLREARFAAKGRFTELKNFYNRPLSLAHCQ